MEYTTIESEAAHDSNKNYFNRRTGEVLPAGSDEPVGVVKRGATNWNATIFGGGGSRTFSNEADAVFWVLRNS